MATAQSDIQNKIRKGKMTSEKEALEDYLEIADEKVSAEQIKLSSEEDLESLLKLAEDLKENIDNNFQIKYLQIYRFIQIALGSFFLISFYFLIFESKLANEFNRTINLISYSISLATFIFCEFQIRTIKKQSLPDKLALREVLQLLREVHGTIAKREDWSILKRAEFRIRLSRFDLSEKKDSVFSFFS